MFFRLGFGFFRRIVVDLFMVLYSTIPTAAPSIKKCFRTGSKIYTSSINSMEREGTLVISMSSGLLSILQKYKRKSHTNGGKWFPTMIPNSNSTRDILAAQPGPSLESVVR